ncbi:purple acid phosphatase 18 [Prunus dulcis]|uniref:Purple acid phosphatase 18 n=1 Tax=Prunus dulcis TaxID=3755 RepID=A0A4Y1R078_PRUDU|nr:purple acid phosphatase 18 [Prunus dulcis]
MNRKRIAEGQTGDISIGHRCYETRRETMDSKPTFMLLILISPPPSSQPKDKSGLRLAKPSISHGIRNPLLIPPAEKQNYRRLPAQEITICPAARKLGNAKISLLHANSKIEPLLPRIFLKYDTTYRRAILINAFQHQEQNNATSKLRSTKSSYVALRHKPAHEIRHRNLRRSDRPDAVRSLALNLHRQGPRLHWQVEHKLLVPFGVGAAFGVHVRGKKLAVIFGADGSRGVFLDGFSI